MTVFNTVSDLATKAKAEVEKTKLTKMIKIILIMMIFYKCKTKGMIK